METRARKKLRGDGKLNIAEVTSDIPRSSENATNKDEQQQNPTIPSLVCEIFLTTLRNVRLLKTCRLVCKTWTVYATLSLRDCSKVLLTRPTHVTDILKLIPKRKSTLLKSSPSPFQNFQAELYEIDCRAFIQRILRSNITISNLSFYFGDFRPNKKSVLPELGSVLAANQNNLRDLYIDATYYYLRFRTDNTHIDVLVNTLVQKDIKLKALKSLKFFDKCYHCEKHVLFVENIVGFCKLERLDLRIIDVDILISILAQDKVKNLKYLKILFREISEKAIEHLSKLRFVQLRSLTIRARPLINHHLQQLYVFCQSVSPLLKDFETNFRISNKFDLRFPSLQNIKVRNNTVLSALHPTGFPALSKVCLEVKEPLLKNWGKVVPHEGVQSVVIAMEDQYNDDSFDQDLQKFLTYLSRQFPKVSSLVFRVHKFSRSNLKAICESFPKLTTLGLDGRFEGICFCGLECCGVNKLEPNLPGHKAVMHFIELERIFFYKDFSPHFDMISHCLPKVPKLKQISFHWNQFMTVKLIRKYLGHVEKIFISCSPLLDFREEIIKLSQLSNVYLRQKSDERQHLFKPFPKEEGFDF